MPKGDASQLRADLDDGFARVANILLEALACAPLAGSEFRVVMFVIRRTYSWARKGRRREFAMDTITAKDIAAGTGLSQRTVEDALGRLNEAQILARTKVEEPRLYAYGVNPSIVEWGLPTTLWGEFRGVILDAHEMGKFKRRATKEHVIIYGKTRRPYTGKPVDHIRENTGMVYGKTRIRYTGNPVDEGALSPTAPRPPGPLTENSLTENGTENGTEKTRQNNKGPAPPAEGALLNHTELANPRPPSPNTPVPDKPPPELTPEQQVIQDAWTAFGFDGTPGDHENLTASDRPKTRGFSGLTALIGEHGIPAVEEWVDHLRGMPPTLPEGAKPWAYFKREFRKALNQPWEWKPKEGGELFVLLSDGTKDCEHTWTEWNEFHGMIAELIAEDNWVRDKGVTKRPRCGLTCIDGYYYGPPVSNPQQKHRVF